MVGLTDGGMDGWTDGQMVGLPYGETDKQWERWMDGQAHYGPEMVVFRTFSFLTHYLYNTSFFLSKCNLYAIKNDVYTQKPSEMKKKHTYSP